MGPSPVEPLSSALAALFYGKNSFDYLLASRTPSKHAPTLHTLIQVVTQLRQSVGNFNHTFEFDELCKILESVYPGLKYFDVNHIVDYFATLIFQIGPIVKYESGSQSNVHSIPVQQRSRRLSQMLATSLEADPFLMEPIPFLAIKLDRSTTGTHWNLNPIVVPNHVLSTEEFCRNITRPRLMSLIAVICRGKDTLYTFLRRRVNHEFQWFLHSSKTAYKPLTGMEHWLQGLNNDTNNSNIFLNNKLGELMLKGSSYLFYEYLDFGEEPDGKPKRSGKPKDEAFVSNSDNGIEKNSGSELAEIRGIEGDQNSCFVDAFLMSLFYSSSPSITKEFFKFIDPRKTSRDPQDATAFHVFDLLHQIHKEISTPPFLCSKTTIWKLRELLMPFNPNLCGEMLDVTEFITTLFRSCLGASYFLSYELTSNSGIRTGNFFHQLINCNNSSPDNFTTISAMLQNSFQIQNIRLSAPPGPFLIIKMPRSNGTLVGCKMIGPDSILNISPFLGGSAKCNLYKLQAVICIQHMHYSAFVNLGEDDGDWVYCDSMGKSQGPTVEKIKGLQNLLDNIHPQQIPQLLKDPDSGRLLEKLLTGIHLCIYHQIQGHNIDSLATSSSTPSTPTNTVVTPVDGTKPVRPPKNTNLSSNFMLNSYPSSSPANVYTTTYSSSYGNPEHSSSAEVLYPRITTVPKPDSIRGSSQFSSTSTSPLPLPVGLVSENDKRNLSTLATIFFALGYAPTPFDVIFQNTLHLPPHQRCIAEIISNEIILPLRKGEYGSMDNVSKIIRYTDDCFDIAVLWDHLFRVVLGHAPMVQDGLGYFATTNYCFTLQSDFLENRRTLQDRLQHSNIYLNRQAPGLFVALQQDEDQARSLKGIIPNLTIFMGLAPPCPQDYKSRRLQLCAIFCNKAKNSPRVYLRILTEQGAKWIVHDRVNGNVTTVPSLETRISEAESLKMIPHDADADLKFIITFSTGLLYT